MKKFAVIGAIIVAVVLFGFVMFGKGAEVASNVEDYSTKVEVSEEAEPEGHVSEEYLEELKYNSQENEF